MKKVLMSLSLLFVIGVGALLAQTKTITGTVTDKQDGTPIPGVSVFVKGTTVGTITLPNGTYTLSVPENAVTLVYSFVGMKSQEVAIGASTVINIALESESIGMDEVIIVAYGTAKKGSFTGSAVSIDGKKMESRPLLNVTKALEGSAPGIQVGSESGQPGSGPSIRIRGIGSINSSSSPLYVVDGVAYSGSISSLNAADIESISVLKDASSSALYGSRAANGVIMITTKKGKSGRTTFNVKATTGISKRGIPEYDRLDAKQYVPLAWEAMRNGLVSGGTAIDAANTQAVNNIMGTNGLNNNPFNVAGNAVMLTDGTLNPDAQLLYNDFDWEGALSQLGHREEFDVNASGGNEKSDYFLSAGYVSEDGYSIKSGFERLSARVNANVQPKKWFKTGINLSTSITDSKITNTSSSTGYANPFFFARNIGPVYPIYKHDPTTGEFLLDNLGNKIYQWENRGAGASNGRHVVAETLWNNNKYERNVLNSRGYFDIIFMEGLKLTISGSADYNNNYTTEYDNNRVGDGAPGGRGRKIYDRRVDYNISQILNFNRTFMDNHNVEVMLGHENYKYDRDYFYGFKQGVVAVGNSELINFTTTNSLYSTLDKYRTEGYFGRINYELLGKYNLSASFRSDASSRYHRDYRWGNFWSIGGAWRINKENFMNYDWINILKLRASYGEVGNDAVDGFYPWQTLYNISSNASEPGVIQDVILGNKVLEWETNRSYDLAIEFGLFDRITGSVEYFDRQSDNLLFSVPLPLSSGMTNQWRNIGTMFNRGIEAMVQVDVIKKNDLNWQIGVNATTYKNEISKLPQKEIITGTKKLAVGHGIYDYWLRTYVGVNDQNGAAIYLFDNSPESNFDVAQSYTYKGKLVTENQNLAKYEYQGSSIPDVYGSINSNLTFKGFDLSLLFTYQFGGKTYDSAWAGLMSAGAGNYGSALSKDMLKRWQKPGDITDVPRMDASKTTAFNAASSRWLTSSTYFAFKQFTLGYTLPKPLTDRIDLSQVRVYASGENLFINSERNGMNPQQEFSGVTSNVYSPARIFTLGVNVSF
jgi:TonB-linked SusC/RagA family outer membrane protein